MEQRKRNTVRDSGQQKNRESRRTTEQTRNGAARSARSASSSARTSGQAGTRRSGRSSAAGERSDPSARGNGPRPNGNARADADAYRNRTPAGNTSPGKKQTSVLKQICRKAVMAFRKVRRAGQQTWSKLLDWMQSRSKSVQYLLCTVPIFILLLVLIAVIAIKNSRRSAVVAMSESEQSVLESYSPDEEENGLVFGSPEEALSEEEQEQTENESEATAEAAKEFSALEGQLEEGYSGEIVSEIQARLMELGYMDKDETTQYFGPLTKSSLKTFQLHNGLVSDGICGEQTYSLLMSDSAKIYVMQEGDSGVDVEEVQHRLYELGYLDNKANVTGHFGEKTTEAAKLFQKKNKLTVDGKIGEKSLGMMYDEDVVGNAFKIGDEAPVIKQCQEKLYKLGYITSKANVKGVFNKATRSAIKSFQRANGLTVDGTLGPRTRDAILSDAASGKSLSIGDSGTDVKNAQKRLIELNYLKSGNDSGRYGDLTAAAVKEFQRKNHLSADGILNTYTLKKLYSSSARKASTPVTKPTSQGGSSGSSSSGGSSGGSAANIANKTGAEKAIAIAESKLGCTYVRGAKGPNTFDCSGFVYYCLKNAGVSCNYMTSSQWASTTRYSRITSLSSAQRGDVLVFSGHVGIYLGGGRMIDASSSDGKVRQSSSVLKEGSYWQNNFICACRVF